MAFLRSFYVADDIWRLAWSLVGCLLALSWLPTHPPPPPTAALQNPFPAELSLFSAVIPRGGCRYAFSDRVKPTFNKKWTPALALAPK